MTTAPEIEQRRMLAASAAAFVERSGGIARARRLRGARTEHDPELWRTMAALGWLGILVPQRYGGLGLGLGEMAVVARELARALAPEPLTAVAVLAATVLARCQNEARKREALAHLVSGQSIPALAWQEEPAALDCSSLATRAQPRGEGFCLSGAKRFVCGAAQADAFLVTARGPRGLVLAWLPRGAAGVRLALEPLADGRFFGALALEEAFVPRSHVLATGAAARAALEHAFDCACVIAGAELLGVMEGAFALTLDYLKTRVQFGRPIGAFQALAHRAADLHVQKELAAAVLEQAAARLDCDPTPAQRAAAASRVKARCAEAALAVTRAAIQLHGAIGFTDEHDAGLYLKRALVLAAWLGDALWHRRRYAVLTVGAGAEGARRKAEKSRTGEVV